MPKRRARRPTARKAAGRTVRSSRGPARFVGRDPSPVLDKYPSRTIPGPAPPPRAVATPSTAPPLPTAPRPGSIAPTAPSTGGPPAGPLIRLDRPFDVDAFANLLGQTTIRLTVPRESLLEVLKRVTDFMGFGIYVYSITVRPAPSELLAGFLVELQRVDYSRERRTWVPFVEKGVADSPFG